MPPAGQTKEIAMRTLAFAVIAVTVCAGAAHAQECRTIADSLERLRCYDAREGAEKPTTKAAPAEDPLIAVAKAAVRKQLRDPGSARFDDLKVRTDKAGKKGVCGTVNSRNSMNGMTGPKIFVFNGTHARILVANEGPENGTSLDRILLGVMLGESLKWHDQFCKS